MRIKQLVGRYQIDFDKFGRRSKKMLPSNYSKLIDKEDFTIYRAKFQGYKIESAFKSVIVTKKKNVFKIYPSYRKRRLHYKVKLNSKNFPGLSPNSNILHCLIVPFMREVSDGRVYKRWRVVVITDKCQVFHNFPARDAKYEGFEQMGDMARFEESAIWDTIERKYPANTKDCLFSEYYFPALPDSAYEYHPAIDKKSKYGNVGFGASTTVCDEEGEKSVPRFYFPNRTAKANPFQFMGGYEPDYKMTLMGTYCENKSIGARTIVWATSDGGRNWYAKFEFSDEGEYAFKQGADTWGRNFGNSIKIEKQFDKVEGVDVIKRTVRHLENESTVSYEKVVEVERILSGNPAVIKTRGNHNLKTGNIIYLQNNNVANDGIKWLFRNVETVGTFGFYKIAVLDEQSFALYEFVSNPYNPISCRHIHHINRVRDGWLLGTGEIYPNGWLYYIQMKEADTYSRISAAQYLPFVRLNNSKGSVQRTVGADMLDGEEQTLLVASDHDLLERPLVKELKNTCLSRNSTGVYKGKLADMDDFNAFQVVYEAKEPAFFFKKLQGTYIYSGQRGEFALGLNNGEKWISNQIDEPLIHYKGSTYEYHVVNNFTHNYIVVLKK